MIIALSMFYFSCNSYNNDLERMGESVRQSFRYSDADNGTVTKIEYLKAISYEKIPEEQRPEPDDVYLCRVYVKGTWSYYNSHRIFNIDDTLDCYFNKSKTFIRIDKIEER